MKHWEELKNCSGADYQIENDLKRAINSPLGEKTLWVLVEGNADPYFYERMFIKDNTPVKVHKAGYIAKDRSKKGGNDIVVNIVTHILQSKLTDEIIGIIDRDYRDYEKKKRRTPNNIFLTDYRDLEMTMMADENNRTLLFNEIKINSNPSNTKYWGNQDWFDRMWKKCEAVSRLMGEIRITLTWHNLKAKLNFSPKLYWDEVNKSVYSSYSSNIIKYVKLQCKANGNKLNIDRLSSVRNRFLLQKQSLWKICRGHDLLSVLSNLLIDSSTFNEEWMTFFMSKEYPKPSIRQMSLYSTLKKWQTAKGLNVLI